MQDWISTDEEKTGMDNARLDEVCVILFELEQKFCCISFFSSFFLSFFICFIIDNVQYDSRLYIACRPT